MDSNIQVNAGHGHMGACDPLTLESKVRMTAGLAGYHPAPGPVRDPVSGK